MLGHAAVWVSFLQHPVGLVLKLQGGVPVGTFEGGTGLVEFVGHLLLLLFLDFGPIVLDDVLHFGLVVRRILGYIETHDAFNFR